VVAALALVVAVATYRTRPVPETVAERVPGGIVPVVD
jgi:hypothetical protein